MNFVRNIFLTNRFFLIMACLIMVMIFSYAFPFLFAVVKTGCILLLVLMFIDALLMYSKNKMITAIRETPSVLSLGDVNTITITLTNKSRIKLWVKVIDELPEQFQIRDFLLQTELQPETPKVKTYELRPVTRGEYKFGKIHAYFTSGM